MLQSGGDIGCRLLKQERTSQPDMMELLDGGTRRPINWPCAPPAAEVVANVNDPERQQLAFQRVKFDIPLVSKIITDVYNF